MKLQSEMWVEFAAGLAKKSESYEARGMNLPALTIAAVAFEAMQMAQRIAAEEAEGIALATKFLEMSKAGENPIVDQLKKLIDEKKE